MRRNGSCGTVQCQKFSSTRVGGCSARAKLAKRAAQIAPARLRRAHARRADIEQRRRLRETARDVMTARAVFREPVIAEVDDAARAER